MGRRWFSTLFGGLAAFFVSTASAAPAYFTYEGYLTDLQGAPVASATESFRFEIFAENGANRCLLYQEDHPAVTVTEGSFIVQVGKGSNPVYQQGLSSFRELANPSVLAGAGGCTFSLGHASTRRLLQITLTTGGASVALGSLVMSSSLTALYALDSSFLSGKAAADFVLDVAIPSCAADQALQRVGGAYACVNVLTALPASAMLKSENLAGLANVPTARANLGLGMAATKNVGTAAGELVEVDGGGKIPAALLPNGLVTSATAAGGDLAGTYPNPVLANYGTAGQYYRVTVDAKGRVSTGQATLLAADIPALDWSKITTGKPTTLTGYGITDALPLAGGTVTGNLATNGNLRTDGKLKLGSFAAAPALAGAADQGTIWFDSNVNKFLFYDGSATHAVLLESAAMVKNINGQTGANQTLATSIDNAVSSPTWTAAANIHTLRLPRAESIGVNEGLISKVQFDTFNAKQTSDLATGMVWIGNGAGKAQARTISGDLGFTSTGVVTLAKLQGEDFNIFSPQDNQFLGFDGADWLNRYVRLSTLRDAVGTGAGVSVCGEAMALVYDSISDKLVCTATRSVARAARTVYVRLDGDDAICKGTADAAVVGSGLCAFRTIQAALNSLPLELDANVTVAIQPGVYSITTPVGVHVRQMGHYGAGVLLTLEPSAAGTVTLTGNDSSDQIGILISPQSRNVYLRGFNLTGFGGSHATALAIDGGAGMVENLTITGATEGVAVASGGTAQLLGPVAITVDRNNARGVRLSQGRLGYEIIAGGDKLNMVVSGSQARGLDVGSGGEADFEGPLDLEITDSTASGVSVGTGGSVSLRGGARIDLNGLNANYPTGVLVYGGQLDFSGASTVEILGVARTAAISIEKNGSFDSRAPLSITASGDGSALRLSGAATAALRASSSFWLSGASGPPAVELSGSARLSLGDFSTSVPVTFFSSSASSRVAVRVSGAAQVELIAGATRVIEINVTSMGAVMEVLEDALLSASMIDPGATLSVPGVKTLRSAPSARLRPFRSEFVHQGLCPMGMIVLESGVCMDSNSRALTTSYRVAARTCEAAGLRLCGPVDMHLACSVGAQASGADGSWLSLGPHPNGGGAVTVITDCDGGPTYTFNSITAAGPNNQIFCCSK